MHPLVKIRKATLDDLPTMNEMDRVSPTSAHWTEAQFGDLLRSERLVLLACGEDSSHTPDTEGALLGFVVAVQIAPEWELENVVVSLAARRKGIGKRLLEAILEAARKTNSEAVFLEVRESNHAARSLYEKSGFTQTGLRKSYYANPLEDAILYRLSLAKPF